MADNIDIQKEDISSSFVVGDNGSFISEFIGDLITSSLGDFIKTSFPKLFSKLGPIALGAGVVIEFIKIINDYEKARSEAYNKLYEVNDVILYGDTISNLTQKINDFCEAQKLASSERIKFVENSVDKIPLLQTLADKYFDLAEKADLSEEEYAELRLASENLVKSFPELEQYYDKTTGKINLERDAVNKLIEAKKQELILNAVSDKWEEALANKIEQELELEKVKNDLKIAERRHGDILLDIAYKQAQYGGNANLADLQDDFADASMEVDKFKASLDDLKSTMADIDTELDYYENLYAEYCVPIEDYAAASEAVDTYNKSVVESIDLTDEAVGKWIEGSNAVLKDSEAEDNPVYVAGIIGDETILAYNTSIDGGIDDTVKTLTKFKSNVENTIIPLRAMFYRVGQLSMSGLINGFSSMEGALYDKAIEIVGQLKRTIEFGLEINSPSKVMYRLGVFTIEGFKDGMESMFASTCKSIEEFNYNIMSLDNLMSDHSMGYNKLEVRSYYDSNMSENTSVNILIPYLAQIAQNTKENATRTLSVNIGDREIAKANCRGQKALGRQIVSGI